jgi:hypothetical protein
MARVPVQVKSFAQFDGRIFCCFVLRNKKKWRYQIPFIPNNYKRIFEKALSRYGKHLMLVNTITG